MDQHEDGQREREQEDNFDPTSFEVIVKSINFDATEEDIEKFFANYGQVVSVKLERRYYDGRSKGSAFVKFAEEGARAAAVADTGVEMMGRAIRVEKTRSKEERVKEFGERPRRGFRGRGRGGRGGDRYRRRRSYDRSESRDRYDDDRRRGPRGGRRGGRGGRRQREPVTESNVIFVGNLNYKSSVDTIWDFFAKVGEVEDVRLAQYPDGRVSMMRLTG